MDSVIDICLLHGFLGVGADWDPFLAQLGARTEFDFQAWAPDLFTDGPLAPRQDFSTFCGRLKKEFLLHKSALDRSNVLIGYSMGGRLALQCLYFDPDFWDAAVLISANPGPLSEHEAQQRKLWEREWQQKFLHEDWDQILRDWNQQGVFSKDHNHSEREEKDFSRELLSLALDSWSVRKHACHNENLGRIQVPVLWCFGEADQKYVTIGKSLRSHRQNVNFVPGAGHRLPMEAPQELAALVDEFLHRPELLA